MPSSHFIHIYIFEKKGYFTDTTIFHYLYSEKTNNEQFVKSQIPSSNIKLVLYDINVLIVISIL